MKRLILMAIVSLILCETVYGNGIQPGKYMLSAPALYADTLSDDISQSDGEFFIQIVPVEGNVYRIDLLIGGNHSLKFEIDEYGKIKITEDRFRGNKIRGSGRLITNKTAKGEITEYSTAWGTSWERSTSEWFLRPATQEEIDKNLKKGLGEVKFSLRSTRREVTKENIIKALGSGRGNGYSDLDQPQIENMIESGEIEYKDGEFIIHREVDNSAEVPIKPDISPEFKKQRISREEIIKIFKDEFAADPVAAPKSAPRRAARKPEPAPPVKQAPPVQKVAEPPKRQEQPKAVRPDKTGPSSIVIGLIVLGVVIVPGFIIYVLIKKKAA